MPCEDGGEKAHKNLQTLSYQLMVSKMDGKNISGQKRSEMNVKRSMPSGSRRESANSGVHTKREMQPRSSFGSPANGSDAGKIQSSELKLIKEAENKIKINREEVHGLSFEPLVLECKKLIVLVRNICARKGILLLEEIQRIDKEDLGVISTNRLGFLLETLVGLSGKQIKTLLGFFDSFQFGYVNIKDFCLCLRDENLLKEVAFKIGNKIEKIKMENDV